MAGAAIFDLDGTLVDTAPDLTRVTNLLLAEAGLPLLAPAQVRAMVGHGARRLITRGFAAAGREITPVEVEALYERFFALYAADIAVESHPFPGVGEALLALRDEGVAVGVCTNKPERLSRLLLDALGLSALIGAVVGPDTLGTAKPDPAPYHETLRLLGRTGAKSVMIGDSETDVLTARAAGVPVIGVTFGYTEQPVASFGPDHLASDYTAVLGAVRQALGNA